VRGLRLAPPHQLLQPRHRRVRALAGTVGKHVVNEDRLINRLQPGHQIMMNHPIRERRGVNFPRLGAAHDKRDRTARTPTPSPERFHALDEVVQKSRRIALCFRGAPLTSPARQVGLVHTGKIRLGHDHSPPRTNRTALLLSRLLLLELPLLKSTIQALLELLALGEPDQCWPGDFRLAAPSRPAGRPG